MTVVIIVKLVFNLQIIVLHVITIKKYFKVLVLTHVQYSFTIMDKFVYLVKTNVKFVKTIQFVKLVQMDTIQIHKITVNNAVVIV